MKILLCNDSYPSIIDRLNSLLPGHRVVSCKPSKVSENLTDVDVVIPSVASITDKIIEQGSFGLIQQLGVGLDNVDIEAATTHGVWVARIPGAGSGNAESVAELAIMFMLMLARRYNEARNNVADGVFFKPSGRSMLGKTACIIGYGDIGKELAKRLTPFGVKLKAVRRRPQLSATDNVGVEMFGLDQFADAVSDSDYVILALPETTESKRIINSQTLALMKRGAFLINVARGGLIDTDALVESLKSGHIAGCGIDVFTEEPTDPTHPLFAYNVLATPHIGGNTDAAYIGITTQIAENIKLFEKGQTPLHVVNDLQRTARSRDNAVH